MNTRILMISTLLLSLTACQNFQFSHYIADQNKQYISAKAAAPLKIPANLTTSQLTDQQQVIAVLPANEQGSENSVPSLLPPGSLSAQIKAGVVPASVLKTPLPDPA
jgi:hypothetical protein